ncbi:MAG: threonine--tRNA ligase [Calditrichaeota bacterium]|nr:threonine--tRNA ligase [Calditrichota bacterium]MCB9368140.1 threonine--tRNA ligase [Calditrichota bacterium]
MSDLLLELEGGKSIAAQPGQKPIDFLPEGKDVGANGIFSSLLDGAIWDLHRPLVHGGKLTFIGFDSPEGKFVYWHSAAHLMAHAIKELWPESQLAIGPPIADGFYYDIDSPHVFTQEDFPVIEDKMREIAKRNLPLVRKDLKEDDALNLFRGMGEMYKIELINDLNEDLTVYEQGNFVDLCRGPHLDRTSRIKHFKILSVAGAYWRGDEKNKMLQRLYATAYPTKEMLEEHLHRLEEAAKRDHRKLGKQLDLFSFHGESPGAVFFHPRGQIIWDEITRYWRDKHAQFGYKEIRTPFLMNEELWHKSGHYEHYRENMYFSEVDEQSFALKPMNCPGHCLIYGTHQVSYRDLPLKLCELGTVHRYEKSGVLHGLFRVRVFTQDDAHIFVTPDQIEEEVGKVVKFIFDMYRDFGFEEFKVELSTRPESRVGSDEVWDKAETALANALQQLGVEYKINPGDGAFYGPKIDFHIKDAIGRTWQCGTVQCDFSMPSRFDLEYVGADGQRHTPVMLHRALLGSMERFIGILIENYAGDLPLWLSPEQIRVLPVSDKTIEYAQKVTDELLAQGIRATLDDRNEKLGFKIRDGELNKIPYLAVIGPKEAESGQVSLRRRKEGDLGGMSVSDTAERLLNDIRSRATH